MRFDLDTEIRYPSGERAGVLRHVMVDENNEVVEVAMATDTLVSRTVRVPVSALSEAPGDVLQINLTDQEIEELPDYTEDRMPAVPEGWQFPGDNAPGSDVFPATMLQPIIPIVEVPDIPENQLSISQGTEIACLDGRWGIVDEVLTGDDGQVNALVGRPDAIDELDRVIPLQLVQQADASQVVLNCTLDDLPNYTQAIEAELEEPDL
ncbi:MAG: hypothetical protein M3328_17765 [Chloroflexota bacterium]|nr:hypothetical protein [Chloroflexota bacterium]